MKKTSTKMRSLSIILSLSIQVHIAIGQDFNACGNPNPCQNGAECIGIVTGDYTCQCLYGWAGKDCEVATNQNCGYNLFARSGNLTSPNYPGNYSNSDECHYYVRVHGAKQLTFTVEMFDTEFSKDVLQYAPGVRWNFSANTALDGNLTTVPGQFTVEGSDVWFVFESDRNIVRPGFLISYVETNPSNCASSLCQNGAVCTDLTNGYYCDCPAGYEGSNCEIDTNECEGVVCTNGEVCVDRVNGYVCQCPSGFTGPNCADSCMNTNCPIRLRPKCGSDGQTYRNRCYLLNARCMDPSLTMVSRGACPGRGPIAIIGGNQRTCITGGDSDSSDSSIEFTQCPAEITTALPNPIVTNTPTPEQCIDNCPLIYEPVCGSDGQTYPNLCKLDVVRCLNDPALIALYVGECVVMTTPCRGDCSANAP
ncbi:uncharacterized protein [Antedon mediterranea]|uniref:uncharacterized protein n=1 Tax=Antedon mediterranea TaxID=105859 RepID=UPI003AF8D525